MADEGDILTDLDMNDGAPNGADNQPSAGIITQYVKDMSVENPNAPDVYQWTEQPQIDLQFNIGANKVNDEVTEVELKINLTAKTEQGNAYLVDSRGRAVRGAQQIGLRVITVFETGAPAGIGFAGEQELLEAPGATERIGAFENLEDRRVFQRQGAMAVRMEFGHEHAQVADHATSSRSAA